MTKTDLTVMHINIRSVLPKQSALLEILTTNTVDVCTLNETWLNSRNKRQLKLKGYVCETSERNGTKKGGGVGIVSIKRHKVCVAQLIRRRIQHNLEICITKIACKERNCVGCLSLLTAEFDANQNSSKSTTSYYYPDYKPCVQ